MEKYSVKKPFTVLVAVIMVLALGVVSLMQMRTDLLPEFEIPYLMVITVYPGASPERVESEVSTVMEAGLGTISGVTGITSTSSENFSLVQLEFEENTNMDSAMVKVSSAVQQVQSQLPDMCMTPSIMELSMDMMASMYVTVSREGYDIFQLSDFAQNTVYPYIERQNGVSSISSTGLVERYIQVELNQAKVDEVNDRVLTMVSDQLADAKKQLDTAQKQVDDGLKALEQAQKGFGSTVSDAIFGQVTGGIEPVLEQMRQRLDELEKNLRELAEFAGDPALKEQLSGAGDNLKEISEMLANGGLRTLRGIVKLIGKVRTTIEETARSLNALQEKLASGADMTVEERQDAEALIKAADQIMERLNGLLDSVPALLDGVEGAFAGLTQSQLDAALQFAAGQRQLEEAKAQLATAQAQYESARETALSQANVSMLLNVSTLSGLIYAQNFSMPAGYIDDAEDNSWLLKVGDEFASVEEMSGALLVSMDGVGDVTLADVADVQVIDNSAESYARMNGERAIMMSIFKNSTASASEISKNCKQAIRELEAKNPGLKMIPLVDQGMYISMIVSSVVQSMLIGAVLAILVLALFLKDIKPTLVVGISIPLSVLVAVVLMYFSNMSLNTMTLGGLSLGIGMLVDNSIVVIENIYRLRSRGVSAPRAAVQGAKQVEGAVIASTLTTVCVFLPLVFTDGTVRQLLVPLGLCIGYCLLASLIVALTVAPAASSTVLRKAQQKNHPWFDKLQEVYGSSLRWCLSHKAIPLTVTIVLLAFCVWRVFSMGIVMLPEISSNELTMSVSTSFEGEEITRAESYALADEVMQAVMTVDGIEDVGAMGGSDMAGVLGGAIGSLASSGGSYGRYTFYLSTNTTSKSELDRICEEIKEKTKDIHAKVSVNSGSAMDASALMGGSGVSVRVYGTDLEELEKVSADIAEVVNATEGFYDASNGMEDGDQTLHLVIDRDKAMSLGLTVAQVFQQISARLTTESTSTTVRIDGANLSVKVKNVLDPLTLENLMDMTFTASSMGSSMSGGSMASMMGGSSSGMAGMAAMMGGASSGSAAASSDDEENSNVHKLSDFAHIEYTVSTPSVSRANGSRYMTVSAKTAEGYNTTVQSRLLKTNLEAFEAAGKLPDGCWYSIGGETSAVNDMLKKMLAMLALGFLFVYLVMVAQFQSLLSPFIVLFTIPLAFTGGMIGLLLTRQQLSVMSLMGFVMLMGTVVNNGIVFVDYVNQLRLGGMKRRDALVATGKTRMRPILMTALTTILAMFQMMFSDDISGQLMGGMVTVIIAGLLYATFMTLYIVPMMYDIFFKRPPLQIDVGGDELDDVPDDAAEFIAESLKKAKGEA